MNSQFMRNTGWIVFAQVYQMIVSLLIGVISARYLGPSNYGTINYAASYISFFTIICALGVEGVAIKDIIDDREHEGLIIGSCIIMRLIAGIFSMISVVILVLVINRGDKTLGIVAFLQAFVLIFNSVHIIEIWYQSHLKSRIPSIVKCIAYTVMSIYKVLLLVLGKSVEWFAFSTSLDSLVIAILFLFFYRRDGKSRLLFNKKIAKGTLNRSYHLIITGLMAVIYSQMDRIMIGKAIGQKEVGLYTAAAVICSFWPFIPAAFTNSARPIIMDLQSKNIKEYHKRLNQLNCFLFWLGVIFALLVCLSSNFFVSILYGADYKGAESVLQILVWSTVFSALSNPRGIWMICEDKQKYTKYIMGTGAVINLILNTILIKQYGIIGAAYATLITEIVCCIVAPLCIDQTREYAKELLKSILFINIR